MKRHLEESRQLGERNRALSQDQKNNKVKTMAKTPDMKRSILWLLTLGIIVSLAVSLDWQEIWKQGTEIFSSIDSLREFVLSFGAWAPVVFFLLQVTQVVFAPIPGGVTVVASGVIFGSIVGLVLSLAGAVVGSIIVFLIGRKWGRPLVLKLVGQKIVDKYIGIFDEKGIWLFIIFLLPFLPDDAVCALAGVSSISFRRFLVLVTVGRLPSMALTILITTGVMEQSTTVWIIVGLAVTVILGLGFYYRERLESWVLSLAGRNQR